MWLNHNEIDDYSNIIPIKTTLRTIVKNGTVVNCDIKEENLL